MGNNRERHLANICVNNTSSLTGNNVSNIVCEYNINITDVMHHKYASSLMKKSYSHSNISHGEEWKYTLGIGMMDCMY